MEDRGNKNKYNVNNFVIYDDNIVPNEYNITDTLVTVPCKSIKKYVNYECKICNYSTSRKGNYDEHLLTRKHEKETKTSKKSKNKQKDEMCKDKKYICEKCEKYYNNRSGLWKHLQKCEKKQESEKQEQKIFTP